MVILIQNTVYYCSIFQVADRWHISQDDVLAHEIAIYKALKFDLHVMPNIIHMYRDNILQQLPDNETAA